MQPVAYPCNVKILIIGFELQAGLHNHQTEQIWLIIYIRFAHFSCVLMLGKERCLAQAAH